MADHQRRLLAVESGRARWEAGISGRLNAITSRLESVLQCRPLSGPRSETIVVRDFYAATDDLRRAGAAAWGTTVVLEKAMDEYVQRHPGGVSRIETIKGFRLRRSPADSPNSNANVRSEACRVSEPTKHCGTTTGIWGQLGYAVLDISGDAPADRQFAEFSTWRPSWAAILSRGHAPRRLGSAASPPMLINTLTRIHKLITRARNDSGLPRRTSEFQMEGIHSSPAQQDFVIFNLPFQVRNPWPTSMPRPDSLHIVRNFQHTENRKPYIHHCRLAARWASLSITLPADGDGTVWRQPRGRQETQLAADAQLGTYDLADC